MLNRETRNLAGSSHAVPARHRGGREHHQHDDGGLQETDPGKGRSDVSVRLLAPRHAAAPADEGHHRPDLQGNHQEKQGHLAEEDVVLQE